MYLYFNFYNPKFLCNFKFFKPLFNNYNIMYNYITIRKTRYTFNFVNFMGTIFILDQQLKKYM